MIHMKRLLIWIYGEKNNQQGNQTTNQTTQNTPFQQDYERQAARFSISVISFSQLNNSPAWWFQWLRIQPCWVAGTAANDLKKTLKYMLCQNIETDFNCSIWYTVRLVNRI